MKFIEVDHLPYSNRKPRKSMEEELEKFMKMDCRYAKVDICDEYSSVLSARSAIYAAVKNYKLPIKPILIDGELYLISTDM